jgi:serine/threonine-protein phosphatase 2A regulatory subunit B
MYDKRPKSYDSNNNTDKAPTTEVAQRRVFANAHAYNINSISLCSDGQLFLSADDLRVNMWNLESGSECFTIVDCKPSNMNELNEVITSAEFHPLEPHSFIHSSSKGVVKMADMRSQALCDRTVKTFTDKKEKKSFFSEVIGSISDVKFSSDGRYILARDYLKMKIWDVNMEAEPIKVLDVHDYVKSKLYELYENDGLFDKFECCFSPNSTHILTGSYSNNFAIFDAATSEVKYLQAVNPRERRKKKSGISADALNFQEKILHVAWHPNNNLVAIAAQNYIYLYHLAKS